MPIEFIYDAELAAGADDDVTVMKPVMSQVLGDSHVSRQTNEEHDC